MADQRAAGLPAGDLLCGPESAPMRRLLARATLGAAVGTTWGWLCNNYLGWVGVILTGMIGLSASLWALHSLREIREQERELERILSSARGWPAGNSDDCGKSWRS
jgi:hypothetical protein